MNPLLVMIITWSFVTCLLIIFVLYRSRLENRESDWIPMTEDAREESAIQNQQALERRVHRFDRPIHYLAAISALLLLTILTYWAYTGLSTPPAIQPMQ